MNGGTCINVPNGNPSYACVCLPSWTGVNCQQSNSFLNPSTGI
jgi:hypothetical protein